MPEKSYWEQAAGKRATRRRLIAGGAMLGGSAVALSLFGCSGGDDDSSGGEGSGLVSKPVDTTSQAKAGGTLKDFATADPTHFDALLSSNANVVNFVSPYAYPRLLKWTLGTYPKIADGSIEGLAAESFELSPDKLTLTFKLRPNMKWDSRAPTSSRSLDAQDVVFSFNKFAQLNNLRSNLAYNAQSAPQAPAESVTAPDDRTVVMKLRQPDSRVLPMLVAYDYFNVMPRESEGGFDPRREVRGHGPWMLESFEPSVRLVWRKNPDYYVANRPFPDRLEIPIIPDYAQRLAQFKAGNIYTNVTTAADVIQTKKDVPNASMLQGAYRSSGGGYVTFGWETGSPFADVRLRQAVSMSIDREAYANTLENTEAFAKEGLELPIKYNTIVYAGWGPAYLDPNSKDFGPNAKYLEYNVAEAKKLVSAAGFPNGMEFEWVYSTEQYGAEYVRSAQIMAGMFPAAGFRVKEVAIPYQAYQNKYSESTYWDFGGVVHRAGRAWPSIPHNFFAFMNPSGSHYHGASADGKNVDKGDPKLNELVQKIVGEFDQKRQNELIHDTIRYYSGQVYSISRPSNTTGYTLSWPAIGNLGLNSSFVGGASTDPWLNYWIDPTKAPLA